MHQSQEFVPGGIRDGAINQIPRLPEGQVVTIAGGIPRQAAFARGPTEYVNDVRTMLVEGYRGALMIKVIRTSANESIALLREVGDRRRYIGMTRKPWRDRMFIGGDHVDQMVRHQRSHVSIHQIVKQWVGEWWPQKKERDACGDRGASDAAQGARPERPRSPARAPLRIKSRPLHCAFLIERTHDPCAQCWRGTGVGQILPQRGAHLFQVFKQRTTLGTGVTMALDIRGGECVQFAVEVDRKSTRLNSSHLVISYAVFCL